MSHIQWNSSFEWLASVALWYKCLKHILSQFYCSAWANVSLSVFLAISVMVSVWRPAVKQAWAWWSLDWGRVARHPDVCAFVSGHSNSEPKWQLGQLHLTAANTCTSEICLFWSRGTKPGLEKERRSCSAKYSKCNWGMIITHLNLFVDMSS